MMAFTMIFMRHDRIGMMRRRQRHAGYVFLYPWYLRGMAGLLDMLSLHHSQLNSNFRPQSDDFVSKGSFL